MLALRASLRTRLPMCLADMRQDASLDLREARFALGLLPSGSLSPDGSEVGGAV